MFGLIYRVMVLEGEEMMTMDLLDLVLRGIVRRLVVVERIGEGLLVF